ncbi:uncharacterized protein PHALS_07091 [Plasmopara halstedii]|uniref:Uncharacterized protein n=1 Tax=Plasmopara halstedii TaxID=4781 RepID=A0A0P1B5J0_PLAHL|nr:uncharacterized protein PHALS_07091 [Plasmopara halstedii]CEG49321.1 hypothetical protein PHALS_07091 [Plasmopara halstedii]|eukprot:XP_024585690.1 hypothetical protein PHALS_07091 [Plasmopara halstedii]
MTYSSAEVLVPHKLKNSYRATPCGTRNTSVSCVDVVNEYEKTLTYKRMSGEGEPYLCVRGDAHLSETWSRRWYRATICE